MQSQANPCRVCFSTSFRLDQDLGHWLAQPLLFELHTQKPHTMLVFSVRNLFNGIFDCTTLQLFISYYGNSCNLNNKIDPAISFFILTEE